MTLDAAGGDEDVALLRGWGRGGMQMTGQVYNARNRQLFCEALPHSHPGSLHASVFPGRGAPLALQNCLVALPEAYGCRDRVVVHFTSLDSIIKCIHGNDSPLSVFLSSSWLFFFDFLRI